jgi:hypothetical protein
MAAKQNSKSLMSIIQIHILIYTSNHFGGGHRLWRWFERSPDFVSAAE